jgi:hypothetical protein
MGVSCHDHPCGFHVEGGLIVALCEIGVVKMLWNRVRTSSVVARPPLP